MKTKIEVQFLKILKETLKNVVFSRIFWQTLPLSTQVMRRGRVIKFEQEFRNLIIYIPRDEVSGPCR